jgi:hypothetical protein
MLRRFRKVSKSLNFWIDAICLNQADKAELAMQVQKMREIYSEAVKVRVWMGDNDDEVASAFGFLRILAKSKPSASDKDQPEEYVEKLTATSPDAITSLLGRPWFQRRWTLQELEMSRVAVVYCHTQKFPWQWLSAGLQELSKCQSALSLTSRQTYALQTASRLHSKSGKILDLLLDFDQSQCSDPRDRIFALYGLANDITFEATLDLEKFRGKFFVPGPKTAIKGFVDYTIDHPSVYEKFTLSAITSGHALQILEHAIVFGAVEGRPSWVPDWSQQRKTFVPIKIPDQLWRISMGGLRYINIHRAGACKVRVPTLSNPLAFHSLTHEAERIARKRRLSKTRPYFKHVDGLIFIGIKYLLNHELLDVALATSLRKHETSILKTLSVMIRNGVYINDTTEEPGKTEDSIEETISRAIRLLLQRYKVVHY